MYAVVPDRQLAGRLQTENRRPRSCGSGACSLAIHPPTPRAAAGAVNGNSCAERLSMSCTSATRSLVRGSFSICGNKINTDGSVGDKLVKSAGQWCLHECHVHQRFTPAKLRCNAPPQSSRRPTTPPALPKHNTHLEAAVVSGGQGHLAGLRPQLEQRRQRHDHARNHVCQGACACRWGHWRDISYKRLPVMATGARLVQRPSCPAPGAAASLAYPPASSRRPSVTVPTRPGDAGCCSAFG